VAGAWGPGDCCCVVAHQMCARWRNHFPSGCIRRSLARAGAKSSLPVFVSVNLWDVLHWEGVRACKAAVAWLERHR
jgi:hypothetical protein